MSNHTAGNQTGVNETVTNYLVDTVSMSNTNEMVALAVVCGVFPLIAYYTKNDIFMSFGFLLSLVGALIALTSQLHFFIFLGFLAVMSLLITELLK